MVKILSTSLIKKLEAPRMKVELKKPAMETMNDGWLDLYGDHSVGFICGLDW